MTVVEELVSVLGLEIGEGALATLAKFKAAVTQGLAGVGGVVAALGAAFAGTVVSVAELGTEVNTTAIKLGVGTDAVQELKYAADLTNVSFESLTTAMKFLSKNAAEGGDAAKRVFEAFSGIPMRDAQGNLKTVDVLIEDFADKIAKTKDPIKQVELAMHALHGQSGVTLLPLLKLGKDGIRKLREEAQDLGYVLDKRTIEASARFTVSLKHLKNALLGIRNSIGAPFINDFADALDWMTSRVRASREWFVALAKDIRDLGQRFSRIIEVGKKAFEAVKHFVQETKLDKLAESVHWVELLEAALVGVATVAVTSAVATAASWILAAAPFILIATMIGLIVDDIAHFVTGGESVLGMAQKWAERFDPKDSPEIQFFKNLIALVLDLGDPAKWRRVADSVLVAFNPLKQAVEAFNFLKFVLDKAKPSVKGGEGAVRNPFQIPTSEIAKMSESEWGQYIKTEQRKLNDRQTAKANFGLREPMTEGLHPTAFEDTGRFQQRERAGEIKQAIEVHIHGASDPHDPSWVKQVQEIIDKANSDAKAAITGGS